MTRIFSIFAIAAISILMTMSGCRKASHNHPGSEYMGDMGVSIAYEANKYSDYARNNWDDRSVKGRKELAGHNLPVKNTIPRGYVGGASKMKYVLGTDKINSINTPPNGYVPFYYKNTEDERVRASENIWGNPFSISESGMAVGKKLYNINCAICHGEKADGNGYLARDGSPYPAAPANLMLDRYIDQSNGFYYFAIMHGKNMMGSYADKLSYEERWQVIHYIRSLQAKKRGMKYNEDFFLKHIKEARK